MSVIFNHSYKHGRIEFLPSVPVDFEDPDAKAFFVDKLQIAAESDSPAVRTYTQDEVDIDPETVYANGLLVSEADGGLVANTPSGTPATIQPDDQISSLES